MSMKCNEAKRDDEIAAHINILRDIAVKYAGTQQLRERIKREVYLFNGW